MSKIRKYALKGKGVVIGFGDLVGRWDMCVRGGGPLVREVRMPPCMGVCPTHSGAGTHAQCG